MESLSSSAGRIPRVPAVEPLRTSRRLLQFIQFQVSWPKEHQCLLAVSGATDWAEAGESHCALRKPLAFSPMALSSLTSAFGLQGEIVKVFVFCLAVGSAASERSCAFSEVP